ncbi:MAG TPA: glycosyltransferase, partial [Rhodanobacteraceae bacterium]|nr:glycosyltransferase [Rhodanobacteraceae bacterium]
MPEAMRVAVVTPYYQEATETLQRCVDSVRAQTHAALVHYCVADGFPRHDLLDGAPRLRHIVLPNAHANYGATPRGIGAQCALADGMDVVCFLDADNLFEPDHVASLVETYARARARGTPADAVFA